MSNLVEKFIFRHYGKEVAVYIYPPSKTDEEKVNSIISQLMRSNQFSNIEQDQLTKMLWNECKKYLHHTDDGMVVMNFVLNGISIVVRFDESKHDDDKADMIVNQVMDSKKYSTNDIMALIDTPDYELWEDISGCLRNVGTAPEKKNTTKKIFFTYGGVSVPIEVNWQSDYSRELFCIKEQLLRSDLLSEEVSTDIMANWSLLDIRKYITAKPVAILPTPAIEKPDNRIAIENLDKMLLVAVNSHTKTVDRDFSWLNEFHDLYSKVRSALSK